MDDDRRQRLLSLACKFARHENSSTVHTRHVKQAIEYLYPPQPQLIVSRNKADASVARVNELYRLVAESHSMNPTTCIDTFLINQQYRLIEPDPQDETSTKEDRSNQRLPSQFDDLIQTHVAVAKDPRHSLKPNTKHQTLRHAVAHTYYRQVLSLLATHWDQALGHIQTHRAVGVLLPPIVNQLIVDMQAQPEPTDATNPIALLSAMVDNQSVDFEPFLHQILPCLQTYLLNTTSMPLVDVINNIMKALIRKYSPKYKDLVPSCRHVYHHLLSQEHTPSTTKEACVRSLAMLKQLIT